MSEGEYPLPDDDIQFLNANGYRWERVVEGARKGLIIREYPLPEGYDYEVSDLMLRLPPGYPMGMIDMFYFHPPIARKDGPAIYALSNEDHFGTQWQRWSRHYRWRPGIDSIATHIAYVGSQLRVEING